MFDQKVVSRALREISEQIAEADDLAKLKQMVVEINALLDNMEAQAAKLERGNPPSHNQQSHH